MRLLASAIAILLTAVGIFFPLAIARGQDAGTDAVEASTTEESDLAAVPAAVAASSTDTIAAPSAADTGTSPDASDASPADTGATSTTARPAVADAAPVTDISLPPAPIPVVRLQNVTISDDETWTPANGPYLIQGGMTVASGGSLTIRQGTIIKLEAGAYINVLGALAIDGSEDEPVIVTSAADDTAGGDTNGDGSSTDPDDERWISLGAFDARANVAISHAVFRYAGGSASYQHCGIGRASDTECWNARLYGAALVVSAGSMELSYAEFGATAGPDLYAAGGTFTGDHLRFGPAYDFVHAMQGSGSAAPIITITRSSLDSSLYQEAAIWVPLGSPVLHLENDWWGSASGPQNGWLTTRGNFGNPVSPETYAEPWLDSADLDAAAPSSNVLFLPGIEGSRLYDAGGKLWEPFDPTHDGIFSFLSDVGDQRVRTLALDADGASSPAVYAEDGDVLGSVAGTDYYASFEQSLDALKSAGTINDWKPVAYDWRFSPEDIVARGAEADGKIYYEQATDTPYIAQTLRALAASSKTGKVTIVAHSEGGLVAKALMRSLGDAETSKLIDKVVLVGVPQSGTPDAIGGLLFGRNEGISAYRGLLRIVAAETAREAADTMPAAYAMLPSQAYFDAVQDAAHPVISFTDQSLFEKDRAAYGDHVTSWSALSSFLANDDSGRGAPDAGDPYDAAILPHALLDAAAESHTILDTWTPPAGVTAYQIAGWGDDSTLAGIEFYDQPKAGGLLGFTPMYRAVTTEDGDGEVAAPSALLMGGSSTPRYWFDLTGNGEDGMPAPAHSRLLATSEMQRFIATIIEGAPELSARFSTTAPAPIDRGEQLRFTLHGGSALSVTDAAGDITGIAPSGAITRSIPGSSYGEIGDIWYVTVPKSGIYKVSLLGADAGTLGLDIQDLLDDADAAPVTTISDIPLTASTSAELTVTDGTPSPLDIASAGDSATTSADDPDASTTTPADGSDAGGSDAAENATSTENAVSSGTTVSSGGAPAIPIIITKTTATKTPAKTAKKAKTAAAAKKKTTAPKKKTTTTVTTKKAATKKATASSKDTQTASALASLPAAVRAAISNVLNTISTFLNALAQLLASLLSIL